MDVVSGTIEIDENRYAFLQDDRITEEMMCWYLTIEVEHGKPPYLSGSYHVAGISLDEFDKEELKAGPDSRIRLLTCGVLGTNGHFRTWAEIDEYRAAGGHGFYDAGAIEAST